MSTFLVDFDVIFDVHKAFLKYTEQENKEWPKGEPDYKKVTGFDLGSTDPEFWFNVTPTEISVIIIPLIANFHSVIVSHVCDLAEASAKFIMIHSVVNFTRFFLPIRGLKSQSFNAGEMILIDESDEEIAAWKGKSIQIPRPWNSLEGDPMKHLVNSLMELDEGAEA